MMVHASDRVQRGRARMIGIDNVGDAAMIGFRSDEISGAIDGQHWDGYVRPWLRDVEGGNFL